MVLGVVGSDGQRMPPHFFDKGLKITQKVYLKVMREVVKPWIDNTYPDQPYVFQQDSTPAHKAKKTQKWMEKNLTAFWPHSFWPPSSPDVAPLDYSIWSIVDKKVRAISHRNTAELREKIREEWADLPKEYMCKVCSKFRPRLEKMIAAVGSHFE